MNWPVEPLKEKDFPELLEFLDRCFAPDASGFDSLLPTQFTDRAHCAKHNHAIREDGRLIGVIGIYPVEWQIGGAVLRVGGIGNVAADPDCRGRGVMSRLMQHAVRIMPEMGFDLSWLGGYRQRYAKFGYEKAGLLQQFFVTPRNIGATEKPAGSLRIRPFDFGADAAQIPQLKALHDAQPAHCVRGDTNFGLNLRNWRRQTWVAEERESAVRAYAVASPDGKLVTEFVAADVDAAGALVAHLVSASAGGQVEFQCNALAGDVTYLLHALAEHRYLTTNGNWLIFDWPKVLAALLQARHQHCSLPAGSVVVAIAGQRANVELSVDAAGAHCRWTDAKPDFSADGLTATRALLGPISASGVVPLKGTSRLLDAWTPLPAGFSAQDYM